MPSHRKPFHCPEPEFWYLVGLIASDGCLSRDRRHVVITSADADYLGEVKDAIGASCRVTGKDNVYRIQIANKILYDRLIEIGLTPKKSLTIGPLRIPVDRFGDFLRGVIDGDGCIRRWLHPTNGREQWSLRIVSASMPFVHWIAETIDAEWLVSGRIHAETRGRKNPLYTLKFGKLASRVVFERCYYVGHLRFAERKG